jgi:hypothetical protein
MGKTIGSADRFAQLRYKALLRLLPDRAEIIPPDRRVQTPSGSYTEVASPPMVYQGKPYVPVRLDISKHYRSEDVFDQEAIVNDFELHLPFDAPILADHKIVIRGDTYEVRKLLDTNTWAITKVALVNRVDVQKRLVPAP